MPKNKIEDLRNLMFETIERLMDDDDDSMDVKKANVIANVGRVIVESAKVEVDFLRHVGGGTSQFLPTDLDEEGKTKFLS